MPASSRHPPTRRSGASPRCSRTSARAPSSAAGPSTTASPAPTPRRTSPPRRGTSGTPSRPPSRPTTAWPPTGPSSSATPPSPTTSGHGCGCRWDRCSSTSRPPWPSGSTSTCSTPGTSPSPSTPPPRSPTTAPLRSIDNLDLIGRFAGRTTGSGRTIEVATTDPKRGFTIELGADSVTFTPGEPSDAPDLVLPAEAFIRLVYGRLDPDAHAGLRGRRSCPRRAAQGVPRNLSRQAPLRRRQDWTDARDARGVRTLRDGPAGRRRGPDLQLRVHVLPALRRRARALPQLRRRARGPPQPRRRLIATRWPAASAARARRSSLSIVVRGSWPAHDHRLGKLVGRQPGRGEGPQVVERPAGPSGRRAPRRRRRPRPARRRAGARRRPGRRPGARAARPRPRRGARCSRHGCTCRWPDPAGAPGHRASMLAEVAGAQPAVVGERRSPCAPGPASSRPSSPAIGARAIDVAGSTRTSTPGRGRPTECSASSSSASKAVPVPTPPDSVDE